ncbi:MAG TPA: hydroxyphenylacetyl-CoA thioesterase PaaI [Paenalcaligenes sp.]|nr:hydroxyphenylacetyl-CoA thioesterase PaaI [Paenalcaligenes sp.]
MTTPQTPLAPQPLAEQCAQTMWEDDAATQKLGMEIVSVSPGAATLTMRVTRDMVNGHNTCHGGYLFTLADSCFAFACNTYNQRTVAQHCNITFIAPAFADDFLTATGKEVSRQGRSGIYDVEITNQDGAPVAYFRGLSRTIKGALLED